MPPILTFTSGSLYGKRNRRLRNKCTVTPWQDFWEFECVGAALLDAATLLSSQKEDSSTQMTLEEAFDVFNVWKARSGNLPHAVESTAFLAQLIWRDKVDTSRISSDELRLAYASAVLRSINGLADVLQQQRSTATSVSSLCTQLGIPAWLVDVRHEATHNKLPTLPVLRMAAQTLLYYFRDTFWDPLSKRTYEDMDSANAALKTYHSAAQERIDNASTKEETNVDLEANESSNNSDDDEDTELPTTNSFAPLQNKSTTKEIKRKATPAPTRSQQDKKRKKTSDPNSLSAFARSFVKLQVPLEVARYSLLSFLVWTGIDGSGGVLLAAEGDDRVTAKNDFETLRKQYTSLLQHSCRTWPGLLCALLNHLVDAAISIEGSIDNTIRESSKKKLSLLEQWVRFLLSKMFLVHAFPANSLIQKAKGSEHGLLTALQSLHVPLNSLCDRCEEPIGTSKRTSGSTATSQSLSTFFCKFLGEERIKNHGASIAGDKANLPEIDSVIAPNEAAKEEPDATSSFGMSLDDMERLLANPGGFRVVPGESDEAKEKETKHQTNITAALADNAEAKPDRNRRSWVRCQSWDPCAVGSLPGVPI